MQYSPIQVTTNPNEKSIRLLFRYDVLQRISKRMVLVVKDERSIEVVAFVVHRRLCLKDRAVLMHIIV